MKKVLRITESKLKHIIIESIKEILNESAVGTLYHFCGIKNLRDMLKSDTLYLYDNDEDSGKYKGTYGMSLTRNKNHKEGYPALISKYGGGGASNDAYSGCMVRISLGKEKLSYLRNVKFKPMDWAYSTMGVNGKEDALSYMGNRYDREELYSHPLSQAEDRLISKDNVIKGWMKAVDRIDILVNPYDSCFDRESSISTLENIDIISGLISGNSELVHIYDNDKDFNYMQNELNINELQEMKEKVEHMVDSYNGINEEVQTDAGYWVSKVDKSIEGESPNVYNGLLRYCRENFGEPIGKGLDRSVFQYDDDKVIKVAHGKVSAEQNKCECDFCDYVGKKTKNRLSITPIVYDRADDYSWIVTEYVLPFTLDDLKYFGIPKAVFENALNHVKIMCGYKDEVVRKQDADNNYEYGLKDKRGYKSFDDMDSCLRRYKESYELCCDNIPNFKFISILLQKHSIENDSAASIDELFVFNRQYRDNNNANVYRNLGLAYSLDGRGRLVILDTGFV